MVARATVKPGLQDIVIGSPSACAGPRRLILFDNPPGLLRFAARLLDLLEVSLHPPIERGQRLYERLTEWSQRIVHARGDDRINGSAYQPIALKRTQRLRQHLLGHSADRPTKLAVSPAPFRQFIQDQ